LCSSGCFHESGSAIGASGSTDSRPTGVRRIITVTNPYGKSENKRFCKGICCSLKRVNVGIFAEEKNHAPRIEKTYPYETVRQPAALLFSETSGAAVRRHTSPK
jgi:hypothetical protein